MNPQDPTQNNALTPGQYNNLPALNTSSNSTQPLGLSSPNATVVNSTPVNNTPDASTLNQSQPVVIPPPAQGTSNAANQAIGASQGALLGLQNQNFQAQQNAYNQEGQNQQDLINQYLQKGTDQINMENAAGVPQLQALSNSLNNQYLTQGAAYNSQYNAIFNDPGVTREQAAQQISDLQQQHGYDLTNTAIQAYIASTNYTNAENIINHQIDLKYAPMKDAIDWGMQFMQQNKDLLSQAQTQQFNAQLQVQQQTYNQGVYNDHLIKDTQTQMIKDAAAQGADQKTLDNMGYIMTHGGTIGDVAGASNGKLQQGSYTPVQTGFDPNTGLPIYSGFNQKTGQLEVKNGGNILGQTGSSDTTVTGADGTGYQMGASTTMGAYASATSTQVNNIKATTAQIQANVGNITDASSAQAAINSVAPKSPITGAQVMSSAQKYGVDPATLIGVMQAETQLGTDGSSGAKQNNWGNVGNTDMKMKTGQSVPMPTSQAGVDAVAQQLAQRKVQPTQNDPAQASGTPLTPQQQASQVIKNAPAFLQPAMNFLNTTGTSYIDSSKVPDNMKVIAQNYASQHGVPILSATQVSDIQGLNTAFQNINQIADKFGEVAADSWLGKVGRRWAITSDTVFGADTPWQQKVDAYNTTTAASAIDALKQVAGSGRLSQFVSDISTSALPQIGAGLFGVFKGQDTIDGGQKKINSLVGNLNNALQSIIPGAPKVTVNIQRPSAPITAPDGTKIIING